MRVEVRRWLIIDLIFAAIFYLVFFAIAGFNLSVAIWISLLFVLVSHVFLVITGFVLPDSRQQYVNLASIIIICLVHIIVASLLSILLSLVFSNFIKPVVIIHSVVLLLFLAVYISNYNTIRRNASIEGIQSDEYSFVNQMIYMTLQVQNKLNDEKLKDKCDQLLSIMRSSQYKSDASVKTIEQIIISQLTDLATSTKTISEQEQELNEIMSQINLRNNILGMSR